MTKKPKGQPSGLLTILNHSCHDRTLVQSSSYPSEAIDNESVLPCRLCCSPALTSQLSILRRISSKDAYMLVYTRVPPPDWGCPSGSASAPNNFTPPVPFPPPHALTVVHAITSTHKEACKTYTEKYYCHQFSLLLCLAIRPSEQLVKVHFRKRRDMVVDIYRHWNVSSVHQVTNEMRRFLLQSSTII